MADLVSLKKNDEGARAERRAENWNSPPLSVDLSTMNFYTS
jgi:hypothetical protein